MKILSIGLDKKIFKKNSESQQRQIKYGKFFEQTHIIVFTKKGFLAEKISDNVWVWPTNSKNKFFYIFDAIKIGKEIIIKHWKLNIENSAITTQDPFETAIVGWWLKRKFEIPLVIQAHVEIPFRYFAFESFLNFIRWFLAKFLIKKADRIRVVSKSIQDYLSKRFKILESKIVVLPIRANIEKLKEKNIEINVKTKFPLYQFYFLTVCRLVKSKNISLQIKTIAKLTKIYPKIVLIIVGDGPKRKKIERLAKKLNVLDNIKFEGWQENVSSYMKTADCFLFSSNYEGYGLAIIEALSCGLPVIATKVGVAPQAIRNGENGYLVDVGDEYGFYKACLKIIEKPLGKIKLLAPLMSKEEYLTKYQELFQIK